MHRFNNSRVVIRGKRMGWVVKGKRSQMYSEGKERNLGGKHQCNVQMIYYRIVQSKKKNCTLETYLINQYYPNKFKKNQNKKASEEFYEVY